MRISMENSVSEYLIRSVGQEVLVRKSAHRIFGGVYLKENSD